MTEPKEKTGFFKTLVKKYNELCQDLGVDNGACRSCTPIVKSDENGNLIKNDKEMKK